MTITNAITEATKIAKFTTDGSYYWAANKHAAAVCSILSKMILREDDMLAVRSKGYEPRLLNGQPIGRVDINV